MLRHLLLAGAAVAALTAPAAAQVVDPTDLHLNTTGSTGTDPVLLNNNQTFTLTDTNNSQSAFSIELIFAVPQFTGMTLTAPTIGTLSTSVAGETVTAGSELNFTTADKAGADLFSSADTTDKNLYAYLGCSGCDASLNAGNLSGSTAFTSLFTATQLASLQGFDVYTIALTLSPTNDLAPQSSITVGSTAMGQIADSLPLGTYVAALAFESDGTTPLDTSFTNTGLVNQTGAPPPPPPPVNEPGSLALLGGSMLIAGLMIPMLRRRQDGVA